MKNYYNVMYITFHSFFKNYYCKVVYLVILREGNSKTSYFIVGTVSHKSNYYNTHTSIYEKKENILI